MIPCEEVHDIVDPFPSGFFVKYEQTQVSDIHLSRGLRRHLAQRFEYGLGTLSKRNDRGAIGRPIARHLGRIDGLQGNDVFVVDFVDAHGQHDGQLV